MEICQVKLMISNLKPKGTKQMIPISQRKQVSKKCTKDRKLKSIFITFDVSKISIHYQ